MDFKTAIIILQILIIVTLVCLHRDNDAQDKWILYVQEEQNCLKEMVETIAKIITQSEDNR